MLIRIFSTAMPDYRSYRLYAMLIPALVLICAPCYSEPTVAYDCQSMTSALVVAPFTDAQPRTGDQRDNQPDAASDATDTSVSTDAKSDDNLILILEGQVTDYIGAGLANVSVTVRRKGDDGGPGDTIGSTKTDKLGDFKIKVTASLGGEPVRGDVVVTLAKPAYADLVRTIHLGDDEYPPFLAETLEGNLTLSGRVIDSLTGKPVKDAAVTVKSAYKDWVARTDAAGQYSVKGVVPAAGEVVVEASGYGRENLIIASLDTKDEVALELKPERIIHIIITDESDHPVSDVTIETNDRHRGDFRAAVSDSKGAVTFRGVHFDTERVELRLSHSGYVSPTGFDREILPPADKPESTHRFTIRRAGGISGKVTVRDTEKSLYGARVMTGIDDNPDSPREWSDVGGQYAIQGVAPGTATVTVHMSGYAPELAIVTVLAGEVATLDIQLGPPRTLTGLLKDQKGEPVVGAEIAATSWRGSATLGLRALTDRDGRFVIENAPSDEFEISVFAPFAEPFSQLVSAAPGKVVELTVSVIERPDRTAGNRNVKVESAAPDAIFIALDGTKFELAKLRGKIVLLDFWATWCGPCIADLPRLKAVFDRFGSNERFLMIGISLDWDKKTLERFLKKQKIAWPQVYDNDNRKDPLADKYGVIGIPSVFLIGPDGKIDAVDPRPEDIPNRIEKLLKARGPS